MAVKVSSKNWTDSLNQERTFETIIIIIGFSCLLWGKGAVLLIVLGFFQTYIPRHQVLFHIDVRI